MRILFLLAIALAICVLPSPIEASWNVDFQGVGGTISGQLGPIDYIFPNGESGNYCSVTGQVDSFPPPTYDQTPKSWSLVDHTGAATGVSFGFVQAGGAEDLVGWGGTVAPPGIAGQQGLNTDYLLIVPADNTLGIITDGVYDFEITGLSASTKYRLGLISSNRYTLSPGVDFAFAGGATCQIRSGLKNPVTPTNYVTVQSDATGKIAGTASLPEGLTEGHWAGMTIDRALPDPVRQWNLDIGGDGTSTLYEQDSQPHPYGPDEFGQWNVMNVPALAQPYPTPMATDPSVAMADSTGNSTNPVTFKLVGNIGGWTGQAGQDTGPASLLSDDIILSPVGAASGLPNQIGFELTGLLGGREYNLTFIAGVAVDSRRSLNITVDYDGDYELGDETVVTTITSMMCEKTVDFTANADGKLIGSMIFPGTAGEGNLAGIRLALLPSSTPPIPGDTNNDGYVDQTDAAKLATKWGATVTQGDVTEGDFNNDGLVNAADASILAANWTGPPTEGGLGSVPEPSVMALVLISLLTLSPLSRRRR